MKYRKIILLSIALLCIAMLFCMLSYQSNNSKAAILEYVQSNKLELLNYANLVIDNDVRQPTLYNEWKVSYYTHTNMVQFVVSTSGFGSNQTYRGFYYSPTDEPLGFQGAELEFIKNDTGWEWTEPNGDNVQYTEKIIDHWYWFEMKF